MHSFSQEEYLQSKNAVRSLRIQWCGASTHPSCFCLLLSDYQWSEWVSLLPRVCVGVQLVSLCFFLFLSLSHDFLFPAFLLDGEKGKTFLSYNKLKQLFTDAFIHLHTLLTALCVFYSWQKSWKRTLFFKVFIRFILFFKISSQLLFSCGVWGHWGCACNTHLHTHAHILGKCEKWLEIVHAFYTLIFASVPQTVGFYWEVECI